MLFKRDKKSKTSSSVIWTAKEAVAATEGKSAIDWAATGLSIDTRTIRPGDLFIALKGDRLDGHDYVGDALIKGASAVMVSRIPEGLKNNAPILIVEDTFASLQALGLSSRHRTGAKIIAVTGSVGKTGTKEMLAQVFATQGQVHASKGSFNNHWGVPFSLASMHAGCDYGIFEIGMNHAGEITPLSRMVAPHVAIITNVEPVHLENFSSVEAIADAKAEIFDGMDHNGVAVLYRDSPHYARLMAAARNRGIRTLSFGENEESDARLEECLLASNGSRIRAVIGGKRVDFTLLIPGKHIALNALSVLLAVKAVHGDLGKALKALEKIEPLPGRGNRQMLNIGDAQNPVTLIDESYNASPVAMQAAFKVLALIDPGRGGRRIAILGDMLELGAEGPRIHAEMAMPLQAANVSLVYTCGPLMKNLYNALPEQRRGVHKDNSTELAKIVPDVLVPGDVVMVKGSHSSRMDVVVEAMRQMPEKKQKGETSNNAL